MLRTNHSPRCACLYSFVLASWLAQYVNTTAEATHVRSWTAWYNTDTPTSDEQDDERVNTIRLRGWQICSGNSPINAECRDVNNPTVPFDTLSVHRTGSLTSDVLDEPCTIAGILCKDSDQRKPRKCANYAIRFECRSTPDSYEPPNLSAIGVAAGFSVVAPILSVAIMHLVRVWLRRRHSATTAQVTGPSSGESCARAGMPPSYSFLFGDTVSSISEIESPNTDTGHSNASFGDSVTQLSSGTASQTYRSVRLVSTVTGIPENQSVVSFSPDGLPAGPGALEPGPRTMSESRRSRFPNMHISIFEIFCRSESRESRDVTRTQTPDLSYGLTPPPEYKDAVICPGSREINPDFVPEAKEKEELP